MAEFPAVLTHLMKVGNLTQADLEQSSGIDRSTISRFQKGDRIPSREQLGQLVAGISGDRDRRLELLFAHLRDEASAAAIAGITLRHIVIKPADQEDGHKYGVLSADFELLAEEAAAHDDFRNLITSMSSMIMRQKAEVGDALMQPANKERLPTKRRDSR